MNRRDTIMIAVLLNAGLLIVLFATSLKSDRTEEAQNPVTVVATSEPQPAQVIPSPVAMAPALPSSGDEVDQMLKQYVTPQVTNQMTAIPEGRTNFLADLQAIGTGASSASTENTPSPLAAAAEPIYKEVKVKKGDVLERIARQNRVSVQEIMRANHLTSTRLKIGQVLKIPAKASLATVPVSSEGVQYYTIKSGDNPWTIAVKHQMKVEELLQLNGMDEAKARRLKPGDRIRIK